MNADLGTRTHLEATEVAAYLDRTLGLAERARAEAHLAECDGCRREVTEVSGLVRVRNRARGPSRLLVPLAVAAALVLVLARRDLMRSDQPLMREPGLVTAATPVPIAPRGVASSHRFLWSAVPGADRYRLTLFAHDGAVAWEVQVAETTATLPTTTRLVTGALYYWKVEARVGFQRWLASDLTEFAVSPSRE